MRSSISELVATSKNLKDLRALAHTTGAQTRSIGTGHVFLSLRDEKAMQHSRHCPAMSSAFLVSVVQLYNGHKVVLHTRMSI